MALKKINAESAEFEKWTNDDKEIVFIPMAHISTPAFYKDVKRIIDSLKQMNYIVYYEGLKKESIADSTLKDEYARKFRKMIGVLFDTTSVIDYLNSQGLFKTKIGQPRPNIMGIDKADHNVDVSLTYLVNLYESKYGKIKLELVDYQIQLKRSSVYPNSLRLPKKRANSIIIGSRNTFLANYIQTSTDKKIVVVYGLLHTKGTYQNLKEKDPKWHKIPK